jgi:hypothetical protein
MGGSCRSGKAQLVGPGYPPSMDLAYGMALLLFLVVVGMGLIMLWRDG